jgi:hypothetical protein
VFVAKCETTRFLHGGIEGEICRESDGVVEIGLVEHDSGDWKVFSSGRDGARRVVSG